MIDIKIENCRNISTANISLHPNELNIRYAMNGTGKSTIAKAIQLVTDEKSLEELNTFGEITKPLCEVPTSIKKVLTFDEDFVSTIVFQKSEVLSDAFEVFIKTPDYDQKQTKIAQRLKDMNINISENADYGILINTGDIVLSKFTTTNSKELKKVGLIKSLTSSKSIFQLPETLKKFQPMMDKDYNVDWVGWKNDGTKFDDNDICPFCTTGFEENYKEEKKIFTESYSKSNVKNIREMLGYFEQVAEYMLPEKREAMAQCIKDSNDDQTITKWVTDFYNDLDFLIKRIKKVVSFNAYHVKQDEVSVLADLLKDLYISPDALMIFRSEKTLKIIDELNQKITKVVSEAENLKAEIGILKGSISASLVKATTDINEFLDMASINYTLEIQHTAENDTKTFLRYKRPGKEPVVIDDIKKSLSWGERNAFALMLFMHYAQSKSPDLIILDDPISSFDTNKKYAIINRLFQNHKTKKSLYKKTALMLTHDFQPVIDFIVNSKPNGGSANAAFLRNDDGEIKETVIQESDIRPFALLLNENASNNALNKVHRIICLRKLLEHTESPNLCKLEYNLISSLLKANDQPSYADLTPMTEAEVTAAETKIQKHIDDFKYVEYLADIFNQDALKSLYASETIDYFKLQIFRILLEVNDLRSKIADPLLKYIDEQFHVENDYVFYLDFTKYNTVPSYVLPKCSEFLHKENVI